MNLSFCIQLQTKVDNQSPVVWQTLAKLGNESLQRDKDNKFIIDDIENGFKLVFKNISAFVECDNYVSATCPENRDKDELQITKNLKRVIIVLQIINQKW